MIGLSCLTAGALLFVSGTLAAPQSATISEARYDYVDNDQQLTFFSTSPASSEYTSEFIDSAIATFANEYLDAHNSFRAQHGARPLVWSPQLAAKAQNWANGCAFKHGSTGENLAAGTGSYTPRDAIKGWTDEIKDYDPRNPKPSHFTQVVWKSSTQLGCAVKACPPGSIFPAKFGVTQYHVCEYAPPGNVIGRFPANVQK